MNNRDLASQAEKYKQEMMKLYGKSTSAGELPQPIPNNNTTQPAVNDYDEDAELKISEDKLIIEQENPSVEDLPPESAEAVPMLDNPPEAAETQENMQSVEERFPEPDLSELPSDLPPEPVEGAVLTPEEAADFFGKGTGFIAVNVRTGDDSAPVEGASVKFTGNHSGKSFILGSAVTDSSGKTPLFELPAPETEPLRPPGSGNRVYSMYDISVTAKGFFNVRSVDVPVFDGITSVQNFSMIPLPLHMSESSETIINYNSEPVM